MKVLDYYDERMVAKACPVSWRMLLGVAAGSCMAAIIWGIVYNGKSPSEIPIVSFIQLAVCLISFTVCLWFGLINTDTTPRSEVQENLKEYRRLRKETLEQHPYKYSIFTGYEHPNEEILCDAFFVKNNGDAAAVSPYILVNETTNVKWKNYLFIIDNTDGHKMLAKELNAFLMKDKSKNKSRPFKTSKEAASFVAVIKKREKLEKKLFETARSLSLLDKDIETKDIETEEFDAIKFIQDYKNDDERPID